MARLLIYYAHPGQRLSRVNRAMAEAAGAVADASDEVAFLDLLRAYPRFDIDVAAEQERLLGVDVVLFQFPLFWYSTPSIMKEWFDLVLEHGFAYGAGGDRLEGKIMMLAVTAAGSEEAYSTGGYQRYPLRTFLTPLERTAGLCHMRFAAPYVLYNALKAPGAPALDAHVDGYRRLVAAIRDDAYDFAAAEARDVVTASSLPIRR